MVGAVGAHRVDVAPGCERLLVQERPHRAGGKRDDVRTPARLRQIIGHHELYVPDAAAQLIDELVGIRPGPVPDRHAPHRPDVEHRLDLELRLPPGTDHHHLCGRLDREHIGRQAGDRPGPEPGERGTVDDRDRRAGLACEQHRDSLDGRQTALAVLREDRDRLDAQVAGGKARHQPERRAVPSVKGPFSAIVRSAA